jgi:hypothetical protein
MWVLAILSLQVLTIATGIRQEVRAGLWSWSKFFFAICFALLECAIIIGPLSYMDMKASYFMPVFISTWIIAALNFIWFVIVARRWRLPDGRTSLQAYRDEQEKQR